MERSRRFQAIIVAWLVVGALDITSAFVIATIKGTGSIRMLQGIASGLLGRRSLEGGLPTAGMGLAIHFFIALVVVLVFYVASCKINFLTEQPVLAGLLYGIAVYLVMYWIVVPLAIPIARHSISRDVTAIIIHMVLIGLPTALVVSHFSKQSSSA
jgi:ACR3 family arsenite efflux pump ArsB